MSKLKEWNAIVCKVDLCTRYFKILEELCLEEKFDLMTKNRSTVHFHCDNSLS